jgi:hypothetical protein
MENILKLKHLGTTNELHSESRRIHLKNSVIFQFKSLYHPIYFSKQQT